MAKKKGLAAVQRSRRTRAKANPPVLKDITHFVLPAFGAYAGTRLISRIVYTLVARKWPRFSKHAGALAAAGTFGGAWFAAHRIEQLRPYHDAIVVGSGIAALQSIAQNYVPKYGWIVADPRPEDLAITAAANGEAAQLPSEGVDEFDYLEAELGPASLAPPRAATASPARPANAILEDDDEGIQDDMDNLVQLYQGSFAQD